MPPRARKTSSPSRNNYNESRSRSNFRFGSPASPKNRTPTKQRSTPQKTTVYSNKPHDVPMRKGDIYFALDCEMVGVGPDGLDSALARVSLVNWDQEIVLDTFVKVYEPVTDYRTFVSGITAKDIAPESHNAMDLEDVRELVKEILHGKILVGHGLSNDLKALGLTHPWTDTRDTATYHIFMRSIADNRNKRYIMVPRRLKELASEVLGKTIQVMGSAHSPIEDASAAMELYKISRAEWELHISQQIKQANEIEQMRFAMNEKRVKKIDESSRHFFNSIRFSSKRSAHVHPAPAQAPYYPQSASPVQYSGMGMYRQTQTQTTVFPHVHYNTQEHNYVNSPQQNFSANGYHHHQQQQAIKLPYYKIASN